MSRVDTLIQAVPRSDRANLLAIVLGVGMVAYVAIEPTQGWLLLLLAGLTMFMAGFAMMAIGPFAGTVYHCQRCKKAWKRGAVKEA